VVSIQDASLEIQLLDKEIQKLRERKEALTEKKMMAERMANRSSVKLEGGSGIFEAATEKKTKWYGMQADYQMTAIQEGDSACFGDKIKDHLDEKCPEGTVICPFVEECEEKVKRKDLVGHKLFHMEQRIKYLEKMRRAVAKSKKMREKKMRRKFESMGLRMKQKDVILNVLKKENKMLRANDGAERGFVKEKSELKESIKGEDEEEDCGDRSKGGRGRWRKSGRGGRGDPPTPPPPPIT